MRIYVNEWSRHNHFPGSSLFATSDVVSATEQHTKYIGSLSDLQNISKTNQQLTVTTWITEAIIYNITEPNKNIHVYRMHNITEHK